MCLFLLRVIATIRSFLLNIFILHSTSIVVFQSLRLIQLFVTPWTAAHQALLSYSVSWSLFQFTSIESVMVSNHLILCCPLLFLPSSFPASRSFPMSWLFTSSVRSIGASASASTLPMIVQGWFPLGLTGLISLLFKGPKSLLQHHNSKASILLLWLKWSHSVVSDSLWPHEL